MKQLVVIAGLCAFMAVPVLADMYIAVNTAAGVGHANGGGEFGVTVLDAISGGGDPIGVYGVGETFYTFCVETDEHVSAGTSRYYVTLSSDAILGGSGGPEPDPLSPESAYLYSLWLDGTDGVNTIAHSNATANALQSAIWCLEGEISSISWLSGDYVGWAQDAVTLGGVNNSWHDTWGYTIGDIRVMNLWANANHTGNRQDLLVRVPLPGAVLLGMLGLGVAGWKLRRFGS